MTALQTTYSASEIAAITGGQFMKVWDPDSSISHLLIDSRQLLSPKDTLFFALATVKNDGHKYIRELHRNGVRNFMISRITQDIRDYSEGNFIVVNDTLEALQKLTLFHRNKFSIPVIGITGSNGKTIVKEWLFQLMGRDRMIVKSPKSYNSQIGVPLSVWQLNQAHELAIFEAGISRPGEMKNIAPIIRPTIGIFTNIGQAHDENFKDTEKKLAEKMVLFTHAETILYSSDNKLVLKHIDADPRFYQMRHFIWGHSKTDDLCLQSVVKTGSSTHITGTFKDHQIDISIPFIDEASVENAIHCWSAMLLMGYENDEIKSRISMLSPVAMRLELKEGINGCSIINDSYSSDVRSLSIALDFLEQQKQHRKKTVILSDIMQSGRKDEDLYEEVARLLTVKKVGRMIGIGPHITGQASLFPMEKEFYPDTTSFLSRFNPASLHDEAILLKGARIFRFETISNFLQQKAHETVLEIDLDALVHNLNYYRSQLKPATRIMAMVKAFSYGSGSFEIAQILQYHHADYLAVAYADEGHELRQAGITLPIMVMNPDEQSMEVLLRYELEPEVYNFRVLSLLEEAINHYNGSLPAPVPVHIKLDTGMHRLGFEEGELEALIGQIRQNPLLKIASVFSHLAASEDPAQDTFTHQQIIRYKSMAVKICAGFEYPIALHIVNSAGIRRFPEAHFDMVRLGISLYGISYDLDEQYHLRNVCTLRSVISQIKKVPADDTIGYNRQWKARKDMTIAVVPIGYADGLSRRLSNSKGRLFVKGRFAPVVGNVCMDMCMIDITDIPAREGDEVIIFGKECPIQEMASAMDTIPYEVLTGISRRVKRVYFQE